MTEQHQCFKASTTAYPLGIAQDDNPTWAIHYQAPPRDNGNGTRTISLNFPVLIVTALPTEPQALAEKAARILNQHWDDEE
jgi:hypothetical protein